MWRAAALGLWLAPALAVAAPNLNLPDTARPLADTAETGSYELATGPFDGDGIATELIEGQVQRQSWQITPSTASTYEVMASLTPQVLGAGYDVLFECADQTCGGFDFRFGIPVIPAPDMHVDLHDFRYLAARNAAGEVLSLLVSRSRQAAYIQMISASPLGRPDALPLSASAPVATETHTGVTVVTKDLAARLVRDGHAVLDDLVFESGSSNLGNGDFASLTALATFLTSNPKAQIAIVGHTDSVGKLSRNITLSKQRARSVRARLTDAHGIAQERMQAEGMGYLAPVATNLTESGRLANRRVEVILLSM